MGTFREVQSLAYDLRYARSNPIGGWRQIMLGAEFGWNEEKNLVEIEHFASQPIRLNNVRLR